MLDRLPATEVHQLAEHMAGLGEAVLGTVCSGTDLAIRVRAALCEELCTRTGRSLNQRQAFACEKDLAKQRFIKAMHPECPVIFPDATLLGDKVARNALNGAVIPVEEVRELVAGFSCKAVSSLNNSKAANRRVVADGTACTGSTFCGLRDYTRAHGSKLRFGLLENVLGLTVKDNHGSSNYEHGVRLMSDADIFMFGVELEALDFGLPVHRARLWMPLIPKKYLQSLGMSQRGFVHTFEKKLRQLFGNGCRACALDDILLPEDHALIVGRSRHLEAELHARLGEVGEASLIMGHSRGEHRPKTTHQKDSEKWPMRHDDVFGTDSDGPRVLPFALFPGLLEATPREADLLRRLRFAYPESGPRTADTSQSAGLCKVHTKELATITPGGHFYLPHRRRYLHGVEALLAQGIHFGERQALAESMPASLLADLAGNAFHTGQLAVMLTCTLLVFALNSPTSAQATTGSTATSTHPHGSRSELPVMQMQMLRRPASTSDLDALWSV